MFMPSGPIRAVKTVAAINEALEKDQGRTFRRYLREYMPQAEDAYRDEDEPGFRSHLGASLVGRDCARELWYTFRWATSVRHEGRMLRLFNRGHLEEPRFVSLLRMIGCEVWQYEAPGKQFRVSAQNGHFGGSLDSVIRGCPDLADQAILGEFKTHNDRSFRKLVEEGVRSAKFEHFVQTQVYMAGYQLPAALYMAVNKNDDDIYAEIIPFDKEQSGIYYERAGRVIDARTPPTKINPSPGWFKCKFCDHREVCHFGAPLAKNCRTCVFSIQSNLGTWKCTVTPTDKIISKDEQLVGCDCYQPVKT